MRLRVYKKPPPCGKFLVLLKIGIVSNIIYFFIFLLFPRYFSVAGISAPF
jgi:hypothetical protein